MVLQAIIHRAATVAVIILVGLVFRPVPAAAQETTPPETTEATQTAEEAAAEPSEAAQAEEPPGETQTGTEEQTTPGEQAAPEEQAASAPETAPQTGAQTTPDAGVAQPAGDPSVPAASVPQPGEAAPAAPSLYVFDLWHSGIEEEDALELQTRFEEELRLTGKFEMVEKARGRQALQALDRTEQECRTEECLVKLGNTVGAQRVVHASVVNVTGDQWLLSGSLVDVEEQEVIRFVKLEHKGSIFDLKFEPITTMAQALSGEKTKALVEDEGLPLPPPPPPLAKVEKAEEDEGGMPWWVWVLIGLGAAAAAGGGGGGGGGGAPGGGGGGSVGGVTVTW